MIIFVDTSGLFALLVQNDHMHIRAKQNFLCFAQHGAQLLTSSFVLVETAALLQRRVGLSAVHDFHPVVVVKVRHDRQTEILHGVGDDSYDFANTALIAKIHDAAKMCPGSMVELCQCC